MPAKESDTAGAVYAARIRVAVVTGGSSGIGAATARTLAARGWRCVLLARGRERLEAVAAEVGGEAEVCDVKDREQVEAVARRIGERHPAVHLLVSNAGIRGGGGFVELEPERIEELTRIDYLGAVWCLRSFLPLLKEGAPSDVVNIVSVAGTIAYGSRGPYAAAKHAQLAFSRSVAPELAPRGIRVHAILPGPVETPGFPQERLLARRLGRRLVRRPEDVAEAILGAIERGTPERAVPRYVRVAALAQALAPGTLARVAALRTRRR